MSGKHHPLPLHFKILHFRAAFTLNGVFSRKSVSCANLAKNGINVEAWLVIEYEWKGIWDYLDRTQQDLIKVCVCGP
jgi:hypothetical protein